MGSVICMGHSKYVNGGGHLGRRACVLFRRVPGMTSCSGRLRQQGKGSYGRRYSGGQGLAFAWGEFHQSWLGGRRFRSLGGIALGRGFMSRWCVVPCLIRNPLMKRKLPATRERVGTGEAAYLGSRAVLDSGTVGDTSAGSCAYANERCGWLPQAETERPRMR